jgi:hypothetical protein
MEIGEVRRVVIVEPLVDPVPREVEVAEPEEAECELPTTPTR